MAYHQKRLDAYRADALAGRPFVCPTCPYCNGTRDPTVKHVHPSTKPADPWDFWEKVLLEKYRSVQSAAAKRNLARRLTPPSRTALDTVRGENKHDHYSRAGVSHNGDGATSEAESLFASPEKAFVVGPMVDQSELPFRMLCRQHGATLAYTPMLHAKSFAEGAAYRKHFFTTTPLDVVREAVEKGASDTNEGGEEEEDELDTLIDRPCIVQFCGHDADTILEAARYAVRGEYKGIGDENSKGTAVAVRDCPTEKDERFYYYCDAVDLNLGCPQGIAKRGQYGSFLMEDWDLIHTIIHTLHVELEVPVTVKIRVFDKDVADVGEAKCEAASCVEMQDSQVPSFGGREYDEVLSIYYAQMVRDAGAQLLCIHGRTREMKGQLSGLANMALIAKMRAALSTSSGARGKPSIPVLSNGNVLSFPDVLQAIRATHSEGHMCAEPLLWDPTLFANPPHPVLSGRLPRGADKVARMAGIRTALNYVAWLRKYPVDLGFVKAHLFKMCFHSYELHTSFRDQVGALRTNAKAIPAARQDGNSDVNSFNNHDSRQKAEEKESNNCDCETGATNVEEKDGHGEMGLSDVDALEAHLLALLAAEEASEVVGEQSKAARAEKAAAKAKIIDVFEEEGDLGIDF